MDEAATRVFVEGVQVGALVFRVPGVVVHAGSDEAGFPVSVIVLQALTTDEQRAQFDDVVRCAPLSKIGIRESQEHIILATPQPAGTFRELPWAAWGLTERLQQFVAVADIVARFHDAGEPVGTLTPDHIVVNEELEPFILGPRLGPRRGPFVAPETAASREINVGSDLYTLGKLLHFVISGQDPEREYEPLPRVEELLAFPSGLVRIVRKATSQDPRARYANVEDLLKDLDRYGRHTEVGLGHPQVEETNLGGFSHAPVRPDPQEPETAEKIRVEEPNCAELGRLPSNTGQLARRAFHVLSVLVILAGGVYSSATRIRASGELQPLDVGSVSQLSIHLESAALSDDFPPVLFAQVAPSWDQLDQGMRESELARLLDELWLTYGIRDGYLHRGNALVAQYWNREVVLVR